MKARILYTAAAALAIAGCDQPSADTNESAAAETAAPAATAQQAAPGATSETAATVATATKPPFGAYLVDGEGRSLYVLEGTRQGEKATACTGACLEEWPPLLAASPEAAEGLDPSRLATVPRDSQQQVTYAGWPLYHYRGDRQPGQVSGQHVHDRWGEWYLLAPSGELIEEGEEQTRAAAQPS